MKTKNIKTTTIILFVVSAVCFMANTAMAYAQTHPGSISGTVTNEEGNPLADIVVSTYTWSGFASETISTTTDTNGIYSLEVPVGVYQIMFEDVPERYLTKRYDAPESYNAKEVSVPGTNITGIDVVMERAILITGSITFAEGMEVGTNSSIALIKLTEDEQWNSEPFWAWVTYASFESETEWKLSQITEGTYRICAQNYSYYDNVWERHLNWYQCYGGYNPEDAIELVVQPGDVLENIEIPFEPSPYHIYGKVTDANGSPLVDVTVLADSEDSQSDFWYEHYSRHNAQAQTDTEGKYSIPVNRSTYNLQVDGQTMYYTNIVVEDADMNINVVVTYTEETITQTAQTITETIPHTLIQIASQPNENHTISGTLTMDNETINHLTLRAYEYVDNEWKRIASTYITGGETNPEYVIYRVPPGSYRVCADVSSRVQMQSKAVCYGGGTTPAEAQDIVVEGTGTTDIDITIDRFPLGKITGVVTDEFGNRLENITVEAKGEQRTTTDENGVYSLHLAEGTYRVDFWDAENEKYVPETYDDIYYHPDTVVTSYTRVSVVNGETVTVSAVLEEAAELVGTINLSGRGVIRRGEIEVFHSGSYTQVATGEIGSDGSYHVDLFPGGTYSICLTLNWWLDNSITDNGVEQLYSCFDEVTLIRDFDEENVIIGSGETVTRHITVTTPTFSPLPDETVPENRGVIMGVLRDINGEPVANAQINLHDTSERRQRIVYISTDENGAYSIQGLPDGGYVLGVAEESARQIQFEYYGNTSAVDSATPLLLDNGETVAVDWTLQQSVSTLPLSVTSVHSTPLTTSTGSIILLSMLSLMVGSTLITRRTQ